MVWSWRLAATTLRRQSSLRLIFGSRVPDRLESLTARGTLEFAAGDRWESQRTEQLVRLLKEHWLPEEVSAAVFKSLGFWAGSEAVPQIRDSMRRAS